MSDGTKYGLFTKRVDIIMINKCSGCVSLCDECVLTYNPNTNTYRYNKFGETITEDVGKQDEIQMENGSTIKFTGSSNEIFRGINEESEVVDEVIEDPVNHPKHYTSDPSGIETIQITENMGFCLGNAVKYIKRCELKGNKKQDLEKAIWYIQREINRVES